MKKFAAIALTLALSASLAAPAMAYQEIMPISAKVGYATTIVLNGNKLDTSKIPASDGIPMRLIAESDYGYANWFAEENTSYFTLDGSNVNVDYKTGAVDVSGTAVEGMTATVIDGVTFLPASILAKVETYKVETDEKTNTLTITTPNNDPTVKICRQIVEESGMNVNNRTKEADLFDYMGFKKENYAEITAFASMMNVRVDMLMIAKPAAGKMDVVKAEMKAYQDQKIKEFQTYLQDQLAIAKAGQIVEKNGYVMLILAEHPEKGVEIFNTFAAAQK